MAGWLSQDFLKGFGDAVDDVPWLQHKASALAINAAIGSTRNRPHPWSTFSDYTSWRGLTDRTYLARHLPPAAARPGWPDAPALDRLFQRPDGTQALSQKSTCLFPAFAQYLTDGFIRTSAVNAGMTTSNHEIDLCPLYGRTPMQTDALRSKQGGRLKSRMIGQEEFAPYFFINGGAAADPQFAPLDPPLLGHGPNPPALPPERLATLFAFGGDRANSTPFSAMMNTLLLREHNRIAGKLQQQNPAWDDDRLFETARCVLIPMFIKVVVEQYINHITPLPFRLITDPSVAWTAAWNRPNWMTVEFSLLYRWHSLMPDAIEWPGGPIPLQAFTLDNAPLVRAGLDAAFCAASAQPAAELGAMNTGAALLPIERSAVAQARFNRLDTYNAYRVAFGMDPARTFDDISSRADIRNTLEALYRVVDDVEFYPGLFAADRVPDSPLPELLMTMVAVDAFSQALTNPLLSEHVFNPTTFTPWGFEEIQNTASLGDILVRNVPAPSGRPVVMTQPGWRPGA